MKIVFFLSSLILLGCATESNLLHLSSLKYGERIYVSRLIVNFNDIQKSDLNCELYINSDFRPEYKISEDGFLFMKSSAEFVQINQIACRAPGTSIWHNHDVNMVPVRAEGSEDTIIYFGDIRINWNTRVSTNKGIRSIRSIKLNENASSNEDEEIVYNAGNFSIAFEDNLQTMEKVFFGRYPQTKKQFKLRKQIGKTR